jgi:hypothetical protein
VRTGLAIAGVLLCAAGAARAEEPLFPLFKTLCVGTHAASAAALAGADQQHWTPLPKSMLSAFKLGGGEILTADGRMTTTSDGVEIMIVARAKESAPSGHEADVCAVAFTAADLTAVKAEAAEFAGVEASPGAAKDGSATVYAWREKGGHHERVLVSDVEAIPADPSVSILMAGSTGPATLLALIVPSK